METFTILLLVIIIIGILAILYINIYNHIQFSKTKIEKVEGNIDEDLRTKYDLIVKADNVIKNNLKANIAYSACVTAKDVEADAIIAYTHTGDTANILAGLKPACPVIAITDDEKTFNKLSVTSNTYPIYVEAQEDIDTTIGKGILMLEKDGIIEKGDKIVIAGGNKILPLEKESQVIGGIMKI